MICRGDQRKEGEKQVLFYDFEVFKYDWLVVIIDTKTRQEYVIVNNKDQLQDIYNRNKADVWVGFNSRHYDAYILKCILCGLNPKELNDWIIVDKKEPWQFSSLLRKIPLNNYDVMPNPPIGLKTLEGFLGSNIKETDVPFNIDRKLTPEEIQQTIFYCRHDVEETMKVFMQRKSEYDAQMGIVKAFDLPLNCVGDTEARITSKVLQCSKRNFNDEFDYYFLPCIELTKYRYVMDWFRQKQEDIKYSLEFNEELARTGQGHPADEWTLKRDFYKQSLETNVAGIPHTFGFGGLHGAIAEPVHLDGLILHVDVGSYYPSMLIAWDLVTRAADAPEQYKHVYDTRMQLKAQGKKKEQAPYKKLLNALSGAMKDATNPAYDPRNNNCMCINGQLMLLDLIEHLEAVPGFELIQSNTDGLIIRIPDKQTAFDMVDDICFDWETRCSTDKCSILLGLDVIAEIYQKDVNNYLWIDADGKVERKGAYVKELSPIDNDLPILNRALVEYMVHRTPVEQTIGECDDLIQFQKVVKLSDKYEWVEHEIIDHDQIRSEKFTYKSYRVFAAQKTGYGRILKCKHFNGKVKRDKFGNTPDCCFIWNDEITGIHCPVYLDKQWYINKAKDRLKDYGVTL